MKRRYFMMLLIIVVVVAIAVSGCTENGEESIDHPTNIVELDVLRLDILSDDHSDDGIEAVLNICVECHPKPVNAIKESGGLHSQVNCYYCHVQHGYIPKCSDCHGLFHGNAVVNCAECHNDPHAPKNITFTVEIGNDACGMCHIDEFIILDMNPTKHSGLDCSSCHTKHGLIPECTNCHRPHDDIMTEDDCDDCHKTGHMPTKIIYSTTTPKSMCSGCHADAVNMINNSDTKHSELLCTQCHPQHGQIPACSSCHATPHGPAITDCGVKCHLSGHDVWKRLE